MDKRNTLPRGTVLSFPGMECTIDRLVGCGSNAIVYMGHYSDWYDPSLQHTVLVRELFPYDKKGRIYRGQDGRICVTPDAADVMRLQKLSFQRGNEIHIKIAGEHPGDVDSNMNTFHLNETLYTVLGFSGGRSLDRELEIRGRKEASLPDHVRRMEGVLNILELFHNAGYLHLDISPHNILLIGEGSKERISLIDYNSVHTLREIREEKALYYGGKEGYMSPEVRSWKTSEIGYCSDLYSLTAVFYQCITGKRLTEMQMIRRAAPDFSDAPCLQGCPGTVVSIIRKILKKGLSAAPGYRYQSAAAMRKDLEELKDRIEGKGITHWALWESGRTNIRKIIRDNPALNYITQDDKMYPAEGTTETGEKAVLSAPDFLYGSGDRRPALLLGSGGIGKTTALLRMAYNQKKEYSRRDPAIAYLSLFGWKNGGSSYIKDKILEKLRFKPETDSMETARHELLRLLSEPVQGGNEERPVLLLLLDGLNEAAGDITPLLDEIRELSALRGVRIAVTSRSEIAGVSFNKIMFSRLEQKEVLSFLSKEGILPPENMELLELLQVPMMLSMYIRTVYSGEKQLRLESKEQLMEQYFASLFHKETENMPADAGARFGAEAALYFVLPEVAGLIHAKERGITEEELFQIVESCYKELDKRPLRTVFPQWIGHVSDLKMDAGQADEWYRKIILELLWKRLGMLIRDERGNYRLIHQLFEEYLNECSRRFHQEFDLAKKRQRRWKGTIAAGAVMMAVLAFGIYNLYMLSRLSEKQEQLLINEAIAQARNSEQELSQGNRQEAIRTALSVLPSENSDRPVTASAVNALADALYVYQEDAYHPVHTIDFKTKICKTLFSDDGSSLITLDEFGWLRAYNVGSETERWSRQIQSFDDRSIPWMFLLESRKAVLCAEHRGVCCLFSLETGEELWRIDYSKISVLKVASISLADISHDENTLVLNVSVCLEGMDIGSRVNMLFSYDTAAGKQKTGPMLIPYDCYPENVGVFSDDGSCYVTVYKDWKKSCLYIVYSDPETGGILKTSVLEYKSYDYSHMKLTYIPEGGGISDGILLYLQQYDIGSSFTYTNVGFLENGEDEWLFYESYYSQADARDAVPWILCTDNNIYMISGKQIIRLTRYGHETGRESFLQDVVYCIRKDDSRLYLVFADGTSSVFNLSSFRLYESQPAVTKFQLQDAMGSGVWGEPFCVFSGSGNTSAYICEMKGDPEMKVLPQPDMNRDSSIALLSGDVYSFPDGSGFVYLDDKYLEEEESENGYSYKIYGTVYDGDGSITDHFSFECNSGVGEFSGFSPDGSKIYLGDIIYDLAEHELLCYEEIEDTDYNGIGFQSVTTDKGQLSAAWDGTRVVWWIDGKNKKYGSPVTEKQNIVWRSSPDGSTSSHQSEYVLGKNGWFAMKTADSDDWESETVSCFSVYSMEKDEWHILEDASETDGQPCIAWADRQPWLAAADWDNKLRIYDAEKEKIIREFDIGITNQSVSEMKFILDDRYLVIGQSFARYDFFADISKFSPWFQIMDTETGEVVFTYYPEDGSMYSSIHLQQDREKGWLYLFDAEFSMTGLCIDYKSWETVFEIPALTCILSNGTFIVRKRTKEVLAQYRSYDLETLIAWGQEELQSGQRS